MAILVSVSRKSKGEAIGKTLACFGEPYTLSYAPASAAGFSGVILGGGGDITPARYGGDPSLADRTDPVREAAELALLKECAAEKIPVLGICYGAQLLFVYSGGALQNVERHRNARHLVRAFPGSFLSPLYPPRFFTNSFHHQAAVPGTGLMRPVAFSKDGVPEAYYHPDLPFFGVQWHPEIPSAGCSPGAPLFGAYLSLTRRR